MTADTKDYPELPEFPEGDRWTSALAIEYGKRCIDADRSLRAHEAGGVPAFDCATCKPNTLESMRFIVCSLCGDKRCPHAADHRNTCTGMALDAGTVHFIAERMRRLCRETGSPWSDADDSLMVRGAGSIIGTVLARLAGVGMATPMAEAVAWRCEQKHPTRDEVSMFVVTKKAPADAYRANGWKVTPLYERAALSTSPAVPPRPDIGNPISEAEQPDYFPSCPESSLTRASEGGPKEWPPAHSLPDQDECALRVANSEEVAKRIAEGGYGADADTPLATELHRFIYEYDDADPYGSAWFMHRLERLVNELRAPPSPPEAA